MEIQYLCPSCNGHLNVNDNIVLIARDKDGTRGLVFLHTDLGNYDSQLNASLNIKKGDCVDFYCPYCHASIDFHKEKTKMAELQRADQYGRRSQVVFSKVYGEECTYHIEEGKVMSYGECAKKYMDPEWFLK